MMDWFRRAFKQECGLCGLRRYSLGHTQIRGADVHWLYCGKCDRV